MVHILTTEQRNSVDYLSTVTRAVYVMKSSIKGAYRFGVVGVNQRANTALKRLAQCTVIVNDEIQEHFTYMAVARFDGDCMDIDIKEVEHALRRAIFPAENGFVKYRTYRLIRFMPRYKDRLDNLPSHVEEKFKKFIANYFQENFGNNR